MAYVPRFPSRRKHQNLLGREIKFESLKVFFHLKSLSQNLTDIKLGTNGGITDPSVIFCALDQKFPLIAIFAWR